MEIKTQDRTKTVKENTLTVHSIKEGIQTDVLLDTLNTIKEAIEKGEVVAFAAVTVSEQDEVFAYTAASRYVTRLRLAGAIAQLQHDFISDAF